MTLDPNFFISSLGAVALAVNGFYGAKLFAHEKRLSKLEGEHAAYHAIPVDGGRRDYDKPIIVKCEKCTPVEQNSGQ